MEVCLKRSKYKFRGNRQRTDAVGKQVSCDGKIRWWSKEVAKKHADEVNDRLIGDRRVRPYKCQLSPKGNTHWHVGREPVKD